MLKVMTQICPHILYTEDALKNIFIPYGIIRKYLLNMLQILIEKEIKPVNNNPKASAISTYRPPQVGRRHHSCISVCE